MKKADFKKAFDAAIRRRDPARAVDGLARLVGRQWDGRIDSWLYGSGPDVHALGDFGTWLMAQHGFVRGTRGATLRYFPRHDSGGASGGVTPEHWYVTPVPPLAKR